MRRGELIFFCGKMGAGKSTLSLAYAKSRQAVLLSEDEWLSSLYPDKIYSLQDYVTYSNLLKPQMKVLVQSILTAGTDVIMDFPANTVAQRAWLKSLYSEIDAPHTLVFIDASDEICLAQIHQRRLEQPERAATDTLEMFEAVSKYFEAPTPQEGFDLKIINTEEDGR